MSEDQVAPHVGDAASATEVEPWLVRHRKGVVISFTVVAVLLVVVVVAALIPLPEYALTPGDALDVSSLVSVPAANAHKHRGSILLTDVDLVPLRAVNWLFYRLNGDDQIYPKQQLIGTLTPGQYDEQGTIDMVTARQAATVVGLRAVGYNAGAVPDGVVDYQPESSSPASSALAIGDVVTAIDGVATASVTTFKSVLDSKRPGQRVTLTLHLVGSSKQQSGSVVLGEAYVAPASSSLPTTCLRAGIVTKLKPVSSDGMATACLGIEVEQIYKTTGAPFPVSIDADGIIGPSAGLAFSLGVVQQLDPADLTGGLRVAATGTMSIDGSVGDVGGVAEKTVAVRNAGATVFFVPLPELAVAKAHAGSTLRVFAVASLSQALQDLEHLGGHLDHAASSVRS